MCVYGSIGQTGQTNSFEGNNWTQWSLHRMGVHKKEKARKGLYVVMPGMLTIKKAIFRKTEKKKEIVQTKQRGGVQPEPKLLCIRAVVETMNI